MSDKIRLDAALVSSAKVALVTPLAMNHLKQLERNGVRESPELLPSSPHRPLRRSSSQTRVLVPLSTSPCAANQLSPRALTPPALKSPRMGSLSQSPPASVDNRQALSQSMRCTKASKLSTESFSGSGSQTQPLASFFEKARSENSVGRSSAAASGGGSGSPSGSPTASPRTTPDIVRRLSSGRAMALNRKPVLICRLRDPLGIAPDFDTFYVPAGKMPADHYQAFILAQPSNNVPTSGQSTKAMDEYTLVAEIQTLRKRASALLVKRGSQMAGFSDTFAELGHDEGRYAEYRKNAPGAEPDFRPPDDATEYETIYIIAPSGF